MDAAALIARHATGTYTVTRRLRVAPLKGRAQTDPAPSTLSIVAAVVPASGKDLLRLPEGRRSLTTRTVYTSTQLLIGGQGDANEADLITIDGAAWEVQMCETWPAVNGYYVAIVQVSG